MNVYRFFTIATLIFSVSISAQADIFKLLSSKNDSDSIVKKYQVIRPVNVIYNYGLDPDDEKYLSISYSEQETNFQDLLQYGSFINNLKDPTVVNILKKMPKLNKFESCYYSGKAVLTLKNITLFIPETASEVQSYADISKVIKITQPKKKCHKF